MKQNFAVIDVNLPKHVSEAGDLQEHEESNSVEFRSAEATELLTYLWDNYIELSEASHVFVLGTNTGHGAIINFIKANEDRAQEQLTAAISFVEDVPLQSCKSSTSDMLPQWYFASSLVFVAPEHNFWFSDISRKPKKRFGRVSRSPKENITDMLIEHQDAVFELVLGKTEKWRSGRSNGNENNKMEAMISRPEGALPPIGNFALSPAPRVATTRVKSPGPDYNMDAQRQTRSPRVTSPQRPVFSNNALPSQPRAPQSPLRR